MAEREMDIGKESAETLRERREGVSRYLSRVNSLSLGTYEVTDEYSFPEAIELYPKGADPDTVTFRDLGTVSVVESDTWYPEAVDMLLGQFKEARSRDNDNAIGYKQGVAKKANKSMA